MMNEYWQDPGKTQETMKDGWLHTGDLARMDPDGYFYLVGRAKDMYVSGGENVYPTEVERVLRKHPGVEDAAVIGIPDDRWGEVGHAFIIPKDGLVLTPDEILSYCEGKLAHYKWPRRVSFRSSFPRTSLGKVRKTVLLEENESRWKAPAKFKDRKEV
jgi:fatty-acyl-CoA synthase